MKFPRYGTAPLGFGGPGAPPGFGSGTSTSTSGGSADADVPEPPRREGNRKFVKVNRDPGDNPRLRSFIDLTQEMFNSLGERGFILRDTFLRWSIAPNPYREPRDPTVDDDASVGVLPGEHWVNTESGAIWFCASNLVGNAGWAQLSTSGMTGTFPE